MNHLQIFFNTKIQKLGLLSDIGNFFLAPVRYFFSGKTVIIARDAQSGNPIIDGNIAKVSSFFSYQYNRRYDRAPVRSTKVSKQNSQLESTGHDSGLSDFLTMQSLPPLLFFIPGLILGTIVKLASYASSTVRDAHRTVKKKLTPQRKDFGSNEDPLDNEVLEVQLKAYQATGQKTDALIIYAKKGITMSEACLKLIKDINSLKVVLAGDWEKNRTTFGIYSILQTRNKVSKWDVSALFPITSKSEYDYSVPPLSESHIVNSVEAAIKRPHPSFFSPIKHEIYVVKEEKPKAASIIQNTL